MANLQKRRACVYITAAILFAYSGVFSPVYAESAGAAAARAMVAKDWVKARNLAIQSRDPAVAKLYEWMLYQSSATGLPFESIAHFIERNPHWPDQDDLEASAERNMSENYPAASTIAWFDKHAPVTSRGLALYTNAALASGNQSKARDILIKHWANVRADSDQQDEFLSRFASVFPQEANRRRLDTLLFAGKNKDAKSLARRMGGGYPALAEARIDLSDDSRSSQAVLALVPANLRNDPGLLYERLKWRRKKGEDAGALEILNNAPSMDKITNKEDWWRERNIMARRMIEERQYAAAYQIASNHQQMDGQEFADAEWLSGWLALRFLNKPQVALSHFERMYPRVKTAISQARAAYWAGMANEKMGRMAETNKWMGIAASYPKVYYGQLAARHMRGKLAPVSPIPAVASAEDTNKIRNSDLGRAIRIMDEAGMNGIRNKMIASLTDSLNTGGEHKALAKMLTGMGLKAEALKIAKKASGKNFFLKEEAYPTVRELFQGLNVDVALAHALIRQESQFDPQIRSPAGAMGLMQVMPSTAAEVAAKRGWQHDKIWMTTQPKQNVLIGSAYLNDLLGRFGGSYPLALAAYNGGPRRVNEWLAEFGDPRKGGIDWVDWIEMIPVYETRNYVQRVMENYVVYKEHMKL